MRRWIAEMGLFDVKPTPISEDPWDWVYEAHYTRAGRDVGLKFNPVKGADPLESARNMVFQDYRDRNGAISQLYYSDYLNAQASLKIKRHHQIEE